MDFDRALMDARVRQLRGIRSGAVAEPVHRVSHAARGRVGGATQHPRAVAQRRSRRRRCDEQFAGSRRRCGNFGLAGRRSGPILNKNFDLRHAVPPDDNIAPSTRTVGRGEREVRGVGRGHCGDVRGRGDVPAVVERVRRQRNGCNSAKHRIAVCATSKLKMSAQVEEKRYYRTALQGAARGFSTSLGRAERFGVRPESGAFLGTCGFRWGFSPA